jgi:hypothetical protein
VKRQIEHNNQPERVVVRIVTEDIMGAVLANDAIEIVTVEDE